MERGDLTNFSVEQDEKAEEEGKLREWVLVHPRKKKEDAQ